MLYFKKSGVHTINFFTQGLPYPVAVVSYSQEEQNQIDLSINGGNYSLGELISWCRKHGCKYQEFRLLGAQ